MERKTCRIFLFNEISTKASRCDNISGLTHAELTDYFNEFIIQLKVSEVILLNFIEKEVQKKHRSEAEERIQQIIELLDEEILPALALTVSLLAIMYKLVIFLMYNYTAKCYH